MMKCGKAVLLNWLLFGPVLAGCSQHVNRIVIHNKTAGFLKIETSPVITSSTGGWENGISYYKKDSIIWRYRGGYQIYAKILSPNYWISEKRGDTIKHVPGEHYADYFSFREDTSVHGQYLMYPDSYLQIGEFFYRKDKISGRDSMQTHFYINTLKLFTRSDTLISSGDLDIVNMLSNYTIIKERKKDWVIEIK